MGEVLEYYRNLIAVVQVTITFDISVNQFLCKKTISAGAVQEK